ncbi:hypothetical protein SPRG_12722 [Saprolegnia parasitica CBS 223.65]|uniref:Uncharacterized protein n=1 Tax=Saprolegnia parasitica (strain CBS 223.65) TaxID=695850 RepID=A0A067C7B0_SAPPC|nr:hypothetical protein SPRG_12722 [Saprolegnia parasitica CBS 223.65]KDO22441.1 hypothetical protein SPRG_12722 [Saprolegnia parasitica CBS 223.65]|eukprot:XP_012206829.1 hypothetical protein SPRG_12722 [Saprolegnia parasitica CBS 223.65]
MATDLYRIRVVRVHRGKCIVVFRVYSVYYDGGHTVPSDASFFVLLLDDGRFLFPSYATVGPNRGFSSANEHFAIASNGQALDHAWMTANAHTFVKRVEQTAYAPATLKKNAAFVYSGFKKERQLEQGVYEVEYTDPKWIEHFEVGHVWQTCCFDMLHCMPIDTSQLEPVTTPKPTRAISPSPAKTTKKSVQKTNRKKPVKKTKPVKAALHAAGLVCSCVYLVLLEAWAGAFPLALEAFLALLTVPLLVYFRLRRPAQCRPKPRRRQRSLSRGGPRTLDFNDEVQCAEAALRLAARFVEELEALEAAIGRDLDIRRAPLSWTVGFALPLDPSIDVSFLEERNGTARATCVPSKRVSQDILRQFVNDCRRLGPLAFAATYSPTLPCLPRALVTSPSHVMDAIASSHTPVEL